MGAATGFYAGDALGFQRAGAGEELGVLLGVDVVGDHGDLVAGAHMLAQAVDQGGLAGSDRAADADSEGAMCRHDLKSLVV